MDLDCPSAGHRQPVVWWSASLLVVWLLGCGRPRDEITTYVVAKTADAAATAPRAAREPQAPVDRMLGAIVPLGERAWFFKLVGPKERVDKQAEAFEAFVRSLRVGDDRAGPPQWTVPAGWRERPGTGMRTATFEVDRGDPPLELTVIPLPVHGTGREEVVVSNVNRWRGQMGLPPLEPDQMEKQTRQIRLGDSATATVVDLTGRHRAGGMGGRRGPGGR